MKVEQKIGNRMKIVEIKNGVALISQGNFTNSGEDCFMECEHMEVGDEVSERDAVFNNGTDNGYCELYNQFHVITEENLTGN